MEKSAENIFSELKEDVSVYARLKLRLLKLIAIERTAKAIAILSHGIFLTILLFFTVLFLFIAFGFYLAELLNSLALGFLIVAGIYLICSVILYFDKDRLRVRLMNIVINAIDRKDDDDEEGDQSRESVGTAHS